MPRRAVPRPHAGPSASCARVLLARRRRRGPVDPCLTPALQAARGPGLQAHELRRGLLPHVRGRGPGPEQQIAQRLAEMRRPIPSARPCTDSAAIGPEPGRQAFARRPPDLNAPWAAAQLRVVGAADACRPPPLGPPPRGGLRRAPSFLNRLEQESGVSHVPPPRGHLDAQRDAQAVPGPLVRRPGPTKMIAQACRAKRGDRRPDPGRP